MELKLMILGIIFLSRKSQSCLTGSGGKCECNFQLLKVTCTRISENIGVMLTQKIPSETKILVLRKNWVDDAVSLESEYFSRLQKLESLDISKNRVTRIAAYTFSNLRYLREINIADNRIRILESNVFYGSLPRLRRIDFRNNKILALLENTFIAATQLDSLNLANNPIIYISNNAFKGLSLLRELTLSGSNLTSLSSEWLKPLVTLQRLTLKKMNLLKTIPPKTFQFNSKLEDLILGTFPRFTNNGLSKDSFYGLYNLRFLTMTACNLSVVPSTTFNHLKSLEYFDLSRNPIKIAYATDFAGMTQLKILILRSMGLQEVAPGAFYSLVNLQQIDLSNNRLHTLYRDVFPTSLSNIINVSLAFNPWACDCGIKWIVISRLNLGLQPVTCASPKEMQGVDLIKVEEPFPVALSDCSSPYFYPRERNSTMVLRDGYVKLFCKVLGIPPPTITWYKPDGSVIVGNKKYKLYFSKYGSELVIYQINVQDAGVYRCTARNTGGVSSRAFIVDVPLGAGMSSSVAFQSDGNYGKIESYEMSSKDSKISRKTQDVQSASLPVFAIAIISVLSGLVLLCVFLILVLSFYLRRNLNSQKNLINFSIQEQQRSLSHNSVKHRMKSYPSRGENPADTTSFMQANNKNQKYYK